MIYVDPVQIPNWALRKGSVVYLRVLKCASSLFSVNFEKLGWTGISYSEIDWQTDFVFAHIMDPVQRRHKGLAQFIENHDLSEDYLRNEKLQTLLTSCLFVDQHSMPYSILFPGRLQDIFWIPLFDDHKKTVVVTQNILNKRLSEKLTLSDWNFEFEHKSTANDIKKTVEAQLKSKWDQYVFSYENLVYERWVEFYNRIKDESWPPVPSPDNFHNLPKYIQQEILTTHLTNSILTIQEHNGSYQIDVTQDELKKYINHGKVSHRTGQDFYYTIAGNVGSDQWSNPTGAEWPAWNCVSGHHYTVLKQDIELYQSTVKAAQAW